MIIIENTVGKTPLEIENITIVAVAQASARNPKVWIHVEKERREVIVNTDDDPVRPGMLAYKDYDEGCMDVTAEIDFPKVFQELGL